MEEKSTKKLYSRVELFLETNKLLFLFQLELSCRLWALEKPWIETRFNS